MDQILTNVVRQYHFQLKSNFVKNTTSHATKGLEYTLEIVSELNGVTKDFKVKRLGTHQVRQRSLARKIKC